MTNPITLIGNTWRKNWPEVRCGLTGGLPGFVLRKNPRPHDPGVPVFCYHVVDEQTFRADLAFLKNNGYTTLSADGLLDHLEQHTAAPPRSVVLSFDDGQRSLYDVALPLLGEFGFLAVAFICPGLHREASSDAGGEAQGHGGLCDWSQIKQMHDSGRIDFQPHTHSHRYVPAWPRALPLSGVDEKVADERRPKTAPLAEDLRSAKETIEQRLGKRAVHMAFPQYYGTDPAVRIGRDLGYRGFWWGVLPGRAMNHPGQSADRIVRVSGEFVRRLPGDGRVPLKQIARMRYMRGPRSA